VDARTIRRARLALLAAITAIAASSLARPEHVSAQSAPVCDPACPPLQICTAPGVCSPDPGATPSSALPAIAPISRENSADACRNGTDDDFDELADCADTECALFVFCQPEQRAATPVVASATTTASTSTAIAPVPADELRPAPSDPVFAMHVNVGGITTFGPSLSLEFGGVVTYQVFVRAPSAGVLNYVLAGDHSNWVDDEYRWGIGAGMAFRLYLGPGMRGMRGFWLGAAAEYQLNSWASTEWYADEVHSLVPTFQLGWRWIWGSFVFGLGSSIGYRVDVAKSVDLTSAACEDCGRDYSSEGVYYLLHLEIGFAI
jgi:hypothetical protein